MRPHDELSGRGLKALEDGDPTAAIGWLEAAIGHAEDEIELAECYRWLALAHADAGDRSAALVILGSALELLDSDDTAELAALCHEDMAEIAMATDDVSLGHKHFELARSLFTATGQPYDAANCLLGMAIAVSESDLDTAAATLRTVYAEYAELDHLDGMTEAAELLAEVLLELDQHEQAASELRRAATHRLAGDDRLATATIHQALGETLIKTQQFDQAFEALGLARDHYLQAEAPLDAAQMALLIGNLHEDFSHFAEAVEAYQLGADLCATHGEPLDVLWFNVNIATVAMTTGDFAAADPVLRHAVTTYADVDPERHTESLRFLGVLRTEQGEFAAAAEYLGHALGIAIELDAPRAIADCHFHLGVVATHSGRYRDGLAEFHTARALFTELCLEPKNGACHDGEGICHYALGQFTDAVESLITARTITTTYGLLNQRAITDIHLGVVYTEVGRVDVAEAALRRGRAVLATAGLEAQLVYADANLGMLYTKQERYREAADRYGTVGATLRRLGRPGPAGVSDQNRAAALLMLGDLAGSKSALDAAQRGFGEDPAYRNNVAGCHRNRALVAIHNGDFDTALTEFAAARTIGVELGTTIEVAKCDFFVGIALFERSHDAVSIALDYALPAAIYIDHVRLQFANAADRIAWSKFYAQLQSALFQLAAAHDDPHIMAELIETSINSGTFTPVPAADLARASAIAALHQELAPPNLPTAPTNTTRSQPPPTAAGASTLVAGAVLPMLPPPELRMPNGTIALAPYRAAAVTRYGSVNPGREVRTW
ncbi:hypothetical protein ACGFIX_14170 [Nocardia salmonicida]|uniref:hypothetical protein n=1 Tax=Nocardia salmonicida TaxID=53431 RepID=UPI00371C492B